MLAEWSCWCMDGQVKELQASMREWTAGERMLHARASCAQTPMQ